MVTIGDLQVGLEFAIAHTDVFRYQTPKQNESTTGPR